MSEAVLNGPDGGDDEVSWLSRPGERPRPRPYGILRTVSACAVLAAAATGALMFVDLPPGIRPATASVATPALREAALDLAAPVAPAATVVPSQGLSGDAAAAIASDPTPAALDRVSPQAVVDSLQAAGPSDPDEVMAFGPMRLRRWLVETIVRAAKETGADPVLLMAIADKESSFITHVKAKTSSAEGLFQFIGRTWLKVVREFGPRYGLAREAALVVEGEAGLTVEDEGEKARILEMRRDPYLSAVLAAEMLRKDGAAIAARIGRELTHGEIYIAHFLGPDDAATFMEKVAATPGAVAAQLLPRPARANRPIFYAAGKRKPRGLSVAQVHRKFEEMMGLRAVRYRAVAGMGGLPAGTLSYAEAEAR